LGHPLEAALVAVRLRERDLVHSAADRLSAAYRRYLRQQGITFGTG
jgi:hypothetical protein